MAYPKPFKFSPKYPKKYLGDPNNIIARSKLEAKYFRKFDENPNVIGWSSEEVVIPYLLQEENGKTSPHRYFVDIFAIIKDKEGNKKKYLIEIKPDKETRPPRKNSKNYYKEAKTYIKNKCKWDACEKFCKVRGMEFIIMTEKNI